MTTRRVCQRCGAIVERGHVCRGNSSKRGYDAKWKKFRTWFLDKHKWTCEDCGATQTGTNGVVMEVHHIEKMATHPELRLYERNCMALCRTCHSIRTTRGE